VDNSQYKQYLYGLDLISQQKINDYRYYQYDGLGSTRALTDASGTLTDQYHYDAFGTLINQTGNSDNDYLYTGEQYDSELDQYYLRARYYDQGVGRFTQLDEWAGIDANPITLNKYLYGNADPVLGIDPSGNMTLTWVMSVVSMQSRLRSQNIASTAMTMRKTAARLCSVCAKLAKRANEAGDLLDLFSYKEVGKATKGTKYQAHHVFQDAVLKMYAETFKTTYKKALGLSIPLLGNTFGGGAKKGSPHYFANQAQKGSMNKNPAHVAYAALRASGCRKIDTTEIVQMFENSYRLKGWL